MKKVIDKKIGQGITIPIALQRNYNDNCRAIEDYKKHANENFEARTTDSKINTFASTMP